MEQVLVKEHGWEKYWLGPVGQTYTIDLGKEGAAVLKLHPLTKQKYNTDIETKICSIFYSGRSILFDKNSLNNYSQDEALKAIKKYLDNNNVSMTDEEWLLSDKFSWFSYLQEGIDNSENFNSKAEIFRQQFTITGCDNYEVVMMANGKSITFPNLILVLPRYVLVSEGKKEEPVAEKQFTDNINNLLQIAKKAGENISEGFIFALDNGLLEEAEIWDLNEKLSSGNVKSENIILLGTLCETLGTLSCAELLVEANDWVGVDSYLDMVMFVFTQKQ